MATDFNKGMAVGLLVSYFLIGPILGAVRLGALVLYVTLGLAAYLFFIKK